tara:strand:- start:5 stop:922 length:918 start_codon:yes stop_codon:yes gene_type:complete
MSGSQNISVLIPCLNEEKTIKNVIDDIKHQLPNATFHLFDNNSSDNSIKEGLRCGANIHEVKFPGKGNVVRRMFSDVDGDLFILIDADNTYDVSKIKEMIRIFNDKNLDMLVARRVASEKQAYRLGHKLGNKIFSSLVKLIFGNQIDDLFSGFRIFSRRFIKSFPGNSKGFEIETELTIHALEQRLPIYEVDCNYRSRPQGSVSKLNTLKDGIRILNVILILIKDERPLFFFTILSILFFLLSLSFGTPVLYEFFETGYVEKIPSAILASINMVISFLCFFSGLILDVIKKTRHEIKRLNYMLNK